MTDTSTNENESKNKTLGQISYEAYGDYRGWKVFNGDPMPKWEDQSRALQEAWEAGAQAVKVAQDTQVGTAKDREDGKVGVE